MTIITATKDTNLGPYERAAPVKKFKTNTYGKVSPNLMGRLIDKGMVDARTRRLTAEGISAADTIIRQRGE